MFGERPRVFLPGGLICLLWLVAAVPLGLSEAAAEEPGERLGSETCEACHEEVAQAFKRSVHWKADPDYSCEGCHGPGTRHVEEMDPELIRRFGESEPAAVRTAACLECHARDRSHSGFGWSDHALASVACNDCHSPHDPGATTLLRESTPGLCFNCHTTVRAQFSLNERHPVHEGSVDCVDCHDPHRRSERPILGGFKQNTCLRCHGEYRGPWFFEHEVVAVEGCTACHTPHGSVNRHLLTFQNVSNLCLQCHPGQPAFHDLTDDTGARNTSFNDCTACHTEIHGSNNDALFLN